MKKVIFVLVGLLISLPCFSQEIVGPDEVKVHDLAKYQVALENNQSAMIQTFNRDYLRWATPELAPGWILFHPTEVGTYQIEGYVMWIENGMIKGNAIGKIVEVTGNNPNPPKPPDPPLPPNPPTPIPGEKYQVMLFTDNTLEDNMTNDQVAVLNGLTFRDELEEKGHLFQGTYNVSSEVQANWPTTYQKQCVVDENGNRTCVTIPIRTAPKELKGWWDMVRGDPMPRIAIAPRDGGAIKDYPLPKTEAEVWNLLENLE